MVAKNLGKIDLNKHSDFFQSQSGLEGAFVPVGGDSRSQKMKTEPVESMSQGQTLEVSPNPKMQKLKENLQRILR